MTNCANKMVKFLYQQLGNDNFIKFIEMMIAEGILEKKLAENLTKPFNKPKKPKNNSADFKRFLKEKRKKLSVAKKSGREFGVRSKEDVPILICKKDKNASFQNDVIEEEGMVFDVNPNLQNSKNPTLQNMFNGHEMSN